MKSRTTYILLFLITLLGLAWRLVAVYFSSGYVFDELISLSVGQKGIIGSWEYLKFENNPPLHYWLLHFWTILFGNAEKIVRLSSVLVSIINIGLIYTLAKNLFNKKTGLLAALFMALSGYQIHYAAEARMYSLVIFWTLLSMICFWKWRGGKDKKSKWLYTLAILGGLYTHITFVFIFLAEHLFYYFDFFVLKNKRIQIRSWINLNIIITLSYLPWLVTFAYYSLSQINNGAWYLHSQVTLPFNSLNLVAIYATGGMYDKLATPFMVLLYSVLFIAAIGRLYKVKEGGFNFYFKLNTSPEIIFLLIVMLIPFVWVAFTQIVVAKYYISVSVPIFILLALGFTRIFKRKVTQALAITMIIAMFLPLNTAVIKNYRGTDWPELGKYLEETEISDDQIILTSFVTTPLIEKYYHGDSQIISFRPSKINNDDDLLLAIKYNWYPVLKEEDLEVMVKKIKSEGRLIIVHTQTNSSYLRSMMVFDWLEENNWQEVEKKEFQGFIKPTVYILEKELYRMKKKKSFWGDFFIQKKKEHYSSIDNFRLPILSIPI